MHALKSPEFKFDFKEQQLLIDLEMIGMVQCKVEPTESCTCATHGVRMDWCHLSRKKASVASASLFVGAPVTIASLLNPWLAKALLNGFTSTLLQSPK